MLAIVIAGLIVALAVVHQQQPQQLAQASPTPQAAPPSPVTPVVGERSPSPTPAAESGQESDRARQSRLTKVAMDAIRLAAAGDKNGAKKKLALLRLDAVPGADDAIVKSAEKEVEAALRGTEHLTTSEPSNLDAQGHRKPPVVESPDDPASNPPEPAANPADVAARAAYRDFRKKLDPLLQRFDLDGARALLATASSLALTGAPAEDLADDQQVPEALAKFLECAARGAKKTVGTDQDFHTAAGARIRGRVTEVDGIDVTVKGAGGEQLVKMTELATEELLSVASQGLTKDSQQDYALGRGLVLYYAGDLDGARAQLGVATPPLPPLAKRILDRINREPAGPRGAKPPAPKAPKTPAGEPSPAAPVDDPGETAAAVQAKVHVRVADFGDGTVGLAYNMREEAEAQDFDSKGCDRFEVTSTQKPGSQAKAIVCLECGISSGDDIAILNKIPMRGDFELSFDFYANYLHPETSNLIIIAGLDAKKRFVGAYMGQQLVKNDGKRMTKGTAEAPDFSRFTGARDCQVKMVRKGDKLTLWFNGVERGSMTGAAGFDGRWGILAHNLRIAIRRFEFKGCPDLTKK
jgi:hypothetical protein